MNAKRKPASQPAEPRVVDVATNRRAGHKFELLDRFECGIQLKGTEVKSLREGKAQLGDAYARDRARRGLAAQCPHPALRPGEPG